jgi:hypothetical protein
MIGVEQWVGGLIIVLLLILVAFLMHGGYLPSPFSLFSFFASSKKEEFEGRGLQWANSGPGVRFVTSASDNVSRFSQEDRAAEYAGELQSGFINAREQPYFPDVTNRVLRMENREKEAVRALGKINQERLRRAAEDTTSTTPLPWGPFWKEWKQTHVMDGEDVASGFEDDNYAAGFALPY